jgi:hypothetical protein
MTLSVDHRVIDGALGAELLKAIVRLSGKPDLDAGLIAALQKQKGRG